VYFYITKLHIIKEYIFISSRAVKK